MWIALNPPMLAWAAALQHAGFFTAILSNMGPDVLRTMLQEFTWLANFNQLTWSCDLGIAKPDPAIYAFTCDRLGVRPDEALFLDDKIENIRGAEAFGLTPCNFRTSRNSATTSPPAACSNSFRNQRQSETVPGFAPKSLP